MLEALGMLEPINKLTKDIKKAGVELKDQEARYLVDLYYQIQEYRKALANKGRIMGEEEPHEILDWFLANAEHLENQIKTILDIYSKNHMVGKWLQSIVGIGPVLSAGLLAHIDITKCPTAGHIWSFAGLDPDKEWLGKEKARELVNRIMGTKKEVTDEILIAVSKETGRSLEYFLRNSYEKTKKKRKVFGEEVTVEEVDDTKPKKRTKESLIKAVSFRPWNAELKTLCWKIGQSFVKVCNNENDVYGKIYITRKAYETEKNEEGEYKDRAAKALRGKDFDKSTIAYKCYIEGKIPPGQIQQSAERIATKIFLSHLQYVWYKEKFGKEPPKPFAIAILGHAHEIKVPNYPIK